jgi:hypothetical protein
MRYAAGLKSKRLPLSALVPLAALAAWSSLVPVEVGLTMYRLHRAAKGSDTVQIHAGKFETTIQRRNWLPFALERVSYRYEHTIQAANVPGIVIETLISLPLSWPALWHPNGLTVAAWRTLSYPFFCLPAWWFLGRGLEGLVGRRPLHLAMFVSSLVLSLVCVVLLLGLGFGVSAADRSEVTWVLWGLGFWAFAFALPAFAWVRQRRAAE